MGLPTIIMIVLLLILVKIQCYVVTGHASTIHVIQSEQQCPTEECFTLSDFINFSGTHNFSSNTTLLFSYGTHVIGNDIGTTQLLTIQDLNRLEISTFGNEVERKSATCLIQCSKPFGFDFRKITRLIISGITFDKCGSGVTLLVNNISSFTAENVTITNTQGVGLFIQKVHQKLLLSNMNLSNNEVNCYVESSTETSTSLNYSIVNSTFSFGGAVNSTRPIGGKCSGLHMSVTNAGTVRFINNTLYENKGMFGNFYLNLDTKNQARTTHVIIKELISTYAGSKNNTRRGLFLKCARNYFNMNVEIINSSFSKTCVTILFGGRITFDNVTIDKNGCFAALRLYQTAHFTLRNVNISHTFGKHIIWARQSSINLADHVHVHSNFGVVKLHRNSQLTFGVRSNIYFINNIATSPHELNYASVLYAEDSEILAESNSYIKFQNNTSTLGGAITVVNSTLKVWGTNITLLFLQNTGTNGGAIAMYYSSQISVYSLFVSVRFIGNTAIKTGGAIYVDTSSYLVKRNGEMKDFIKLEAATNQCPTIEYINNTARLSGNDLYGGWLNSRIQICPLTDIKNINNALLSSDPVRVCICNNNSIPDCNIIEHPVELYPGQTFEVLAVAVGWGFGTVPTIVQARFESTSDKTKLKVGQYVQSVDRHCTNLSYKLYSAKKKERLRLLVEEHSIPKNIPNSTLLHQNLVVNITVKQCPPGFSFNDTLSVCTCHTFLTSNNIECDMELYKIVRTGQTWIKASNNTTGITISKYCPYDYCKGRGDFNLEYPDNQCAFNRSGILCGACQTGLSQVFGTTKCKTCSSLWVLLIVPVFILAGIALVVCVMALNLTVSVGTVNGLILYTNIVRANQAIFFPPEISNSFLSWFVAWVNLDFGIEACFYDGLDAYAKTWLQFLFPLYIWFIVIAIINLSRRFDTIARICGKSAVSVLATLFLLSYAKLLRIIIIVFQPTTLSHSDAYPTGVWFYDGNVRYFKGKHIPLFIAALMLLVFLSIPYTAILLTIQWLQKLSEHRVLFWVNRLKPLFDAYTGPYKDDHRYWTGLLLLVRVLLYLIFALNVSNNPSINLLAIIIVLVVMLSIPFLNGRVYKSRLVNLIEVSFLLNVSILAAATLYQINSSVSSKWPTILSTSIAFITFVAIALKHLIQRIASKKWFRIRWIPMYASSMELKARLNRKTHQVEEEETVVTVDTSESKDKKGAELTHTSVQLREPLLDY